jgi:kynurenine formamidase
MPRPRPSRIVDLSKEIADNRNDPFFMRVRIRHYSHARARWLVRALGLPFRLFPKAFVGWADDTITKMGVHATTHIDAPWHYGPTDEVGRKLPTIDEMPLHLCFGPGVVIDVRDKPEGEYISAADLEEALARSGASIARGMIVLIRTGMDRHQGHRDYWQRGIGVSAEATEWLLDRGVEVMGVDQWGWDTPFRMEIARARAAKDGSRFWEGHLVGRRRPYWQIEQLRGLDQLPSHGFDVAVFPLRLKGASAAPARVVAFLYEEAAAI